MTDLESKNLRRWLPKGAAKELAKEFNHSIVYIRKVLEGKRTNIHVLARAIEMAKREKDVFEQNLENAAKL